ncbi:unnamed protein product [Ambrosiozyma monospora]|uniref:Unnamed protein product n=1 Tax=Ambrosiozyma monospora TaxID=43982 RepID=A0A9W7DIN9_AMBMO|nr:unnamed protein product [Ambrosiozyma monospora]
MEVEGRKSADDFESKVFVCIHPTEPLPFKLDGEEEDDLEIEGGKINLNCPISGQPMVDPYINLKCKHVYDKTHIKEYLRGLRECPICGIQMQFSDLRPDPLTKKRIIFNTRDLELEEIRKKTIDNNEVDKL